MTEIAEDAFEGCDCPMLIAHVNSKAAAILPDIPGIAYTFTYFMEDDMPIVGGADR